MKRLFFLMLPCLLSNAMAEENHEAFARQQEKKANLLTAPFESDIKNLEKIAQTRLEEGKTLISTLPSVPSPVTKPAYPDVIVFVSFSMPEKSLQQWIQQTAAEGGAVVIRGLINNSFQDTTRILAALLKQHQGGILLDPTLFRRFNIEKVPAVVWQQGKPCPEGQSCPERFDVFYGDTTLSYALKKLKQARGEKSA